MTATAWQSALRKQLPSVAQAVANRLSADGFARPVFRVKDVDHTRLVSIDFETYYDDDYTLRKLSTSEYVRDPRFKAQMMYLKVGNKMPRIIPAAKIAAELRKINWSTHALLCHHTQFDGLILSHHYSVVPCFYYDTLSMARGLHSNEIGAGLDEVSAYYGGKGKLDGILEKTKGVRDWSPTLFKEVTPYCLNDGNEMLRVFNEMIWSLPVEEIDLIDLIVRMFCDPILKLDLPRIEAELTRELAERETLLRSIINVDDYRDAKLVKGKEKLLPQAEQDMIIIKRVIGSNDRFAELLKAEDVDPPVKLSPAWMKRSSEERAATPDDKWVYAFAKDDIEFANLPDDQTRWTVEYDLDDPDQVKLLAEKSERLRALVDARIAVKSTTNITRAERFLSSGANGMRLPVYYAYSRAHTHRLGGGDKRNPQNLKRGGELRQSILAPDGHVLVVCDSGQIECRVNGYLWGQTDLLDSFRAADAWDKTKGVARGADRDAYCKFADLIYGREITTLDKMERFVGKVCVAGDTRVLTNHGVKSIVDVRSTDLLWDGIAWVNHDGLILQGRKQVLRTHGFAATPDHEILTARGWQEWSAVLTDPSLTQSALSLATSPSCAGRTTSPKTGSPGVTGLFAGALAALKTWSTSAASKLGAALAATLAPKWRRQPSGTGSTKTPWSMTGTAPAYSTGSLLPSPDAATQITPPSSTTVFEVYQWLKSGVKTAVRFFVTSKLSPGGTSLSSRWIATTLTTATSQETSGSSVKATISKTSVASKTWNNASEILSETTQTYDLANAGPRHCFTIITDAGPLIIHNCVLGLGFQMGAAKLQITLAKGALGGPPVFFSLEKCKAIVNTYRRLNRKIEDGWKICEKIIEDMAAGHEGKHGPICWEKDCIWLPNGMKLHYPGLKKAVGDKGWDEWTYSSTLKGQPVRKKIYGGLLCENIVQALARIIVMYQMLDLSKSMRIVMTTHDEMVAAVKKRSADAAINRMMARMVRPLDWCPDIPLAAEGGWAENYSK